jgi:hypothetical protein
MKKAPMFIERNFKTNLFVKTHYHVIAKSQKPFLINPIHGQLGFF